MRFSKEFLYYPDFWEWIVPQCGNRQAAARLIAPLVNSTPESIAELGRKVLNGGWPISPPQQWRWGWPMPPYPGNPEIGEREFSRFLDDELNRRRRRALYNAAVPPEEHDRPSKTFSPPHGTPQDSPIGNMVEDATGVSQGHEHSSRILEPMFESREVPSTFDEIVDGFIRAQREKKLHERSQFTARIDMRDLNLPVLIFQHTDVHYGSEDVDYDAIRRHMNILKDNGGFEGLPRLVYAFFTGDAGEYAKLKHRGAVDGQIKDPTVQSRAIRTALVETWDGWLAACLGNHDMRVYQETGFDIAEYFFGEVPSGQTRIPLLRDGGYVYLHLGDQIYTHNIFHGDSAFGTRFNENHKGRQTARLVDGRFDVTWNGHTHNPAIQDASEPSDDGAGARDACYMQGGSYKVLGDDHARRRKFLMVNDVQMPAVVQFPDAHVTIPFKRVESALFFHRAVVAAYMEGKTIRDVLPEPREA